MWHIFQCIDLQAPLMLYIYEHMASVFREVTIVHKHPTVFILFIAVSVFRMAHRATALHSDKAVESSLS